MLYFQSSKEIEVQETAKPARVFRFGVFEVDATTGELRKQGLRIRLQEQPSRLLLMLLGRAGEVVNREEIRSKLWPPDTFVDFDQSLGTALRKLRQALCDDAETPRYIETIPKRGFRFVAPVERISGMPQGADAIRPDGASEVQIPETEGEPRTFRRMPSVWWLALAAAVAALSFCIGWLVQLRPATPDGGGQHLLTPIRSSVLPPSNCSFEHSSFSVSPDGRRLAFVAVGPDGNDKLWVRALSAPNAQQINGTDGALLPFWSPDGRRIGFFAGGKLDMVDLDNGAVRVLCEAPFGRCGGAWSRDGNIVFSPAVDGPLYRIPDSGGVPVPVTRMNHGSAGERHMWPSFLPDGRHFLYSDSFGPVSLEGWIRGFLRMDISWRFPRMMPETENSSSVYAIWRTALVRIPRTGALLLASPNGGTDRSPAWSPDGKRVTYTTLNAVKEVAADGSSPPQLLLKGGVYLGHMDWSPDGHLVYTDFSAGFPSLKVYSAADHRVVPFAIGAEARFSPDGKWIAYVGPLTVPDVDAILIAPFPGPGGRRIRISSGSGAQPTWAHDGRRLFYVAPDRKLMMVEFDPRAKSASAPHVVFQSRIVAPNFSDTQYAVAPDGRLLINSFPPNASSPLTLVAGWTAELKP